MSKITVDTVEPATGTSLTLGASGDTITVPAGATLTNSGTMTNSGTATGFGKVLQVLSTFYTTKNSTTNGVADPFVTTGLTATITPASTSNKVLCLLSVSIGNSTGNPNHLRLMRDSTPIGISNIATGVQQDASFNHYSANNSSPYTFSFSFLDSPSTTSATTYALYWHTSAGTGYINSGGDETNATYVHKAPSSFTLMEIEG